MPGLADLFAEIARCDDLRKLTEAAASNVDLFSSLAAVVADDSLHEIVRSILAAPGLSELEFFYFSRFANSELEPLT